MGLRTQANPRNSPDLNPIEKIWRTLKQRQKNFGTAIRSVEQLKDVLEQEWNRITFEEINQWIDELPRLMNEVCRRGGRPIVSLALTTPPAD
jgi:transposase